MAIDNTPVTASLVMDRSKTLGNSEGLDDRGRLHVKVANKDTEAVPVEIVESNGTPKFLDYSNVPVGAGPHTIISHTVTATNKLKITRLEIMCRMESMVQVKINGSIVATLATGAAQPSTNFQWSPGRDCSTGSLVEVILTKRAGSPDVTVGAHLMGVES